MLRVASFFAFLGIFSSLLGKPPMILFFDINKTVMHGDESKGLSPKQTIMNTLCEQVFDDFNQSGELISYKSYVNHTLVPGHDHDKETKKKREQHYQSLLPFLKENQPKIYSQTQKKYENLCSILDQWEGPVAPAFLNLLNFISTQDRLISIVFRTFGTDLPKIQKHLNEKLNIIEDWKFKNHVLTKENIIKDTPMDILNTIQIGYHYAWQDDFDYWNKNGETTSFGKLFPLYLEPSNQNPLCMFFDDNVFDPVNPNRQIIAPFPLDGKATNKELSEKGFLVNVDPLAVIENENYFIEKVTPLLKKFGS